MKTRYETGRLVLVPLSPADVDFIFELVNTAGWLQFIGDRQVRNTGDAAAYIQKILHSKGITYLVVKLKDRQTPVGIVTLIKRDYLSHPDIGFAFLPAYAKQGFAFEATKTVLDDVLVSGNDPCILATTLQHNQASIQLLKKLGFVYTREITVGNDKLQLFEVKKNG